MLKNALALAGGLVLVLALLAAFAVVADRVLRSPADRSFRESFRKVETGMVEKQVLDLLGPPDQRSTEFFLGQRLGFEDAYRRASEVQSEYFLVWRREIDVVYSVGIDRDGRVTIAESGGT